MKEIDEVDDDETYSNFEEKSHKLTNISENFEADSREKVTSVIQSAEKILKHIPDLDFKQSTIQVKQLF